jgi:hypothetical protein
LRSKIMSYPEIGGWKRGEQRICRCFGSVAVGDLLPDLFLMSVHRLSDRLVVPPLSDRAFVFGSDHARILDSARTVGSDPDRRPLDVMPIETHTRGVTKG